MLALLLAVYSAVVLASDKIQLLSAFRGQPSPVFACPQRMTPLSLVNRYYGLLKDSYWVRLGGQSDS